VLVGKQIVVTLLFIAFIGGIVFLAQSGNNSSSLSLKFTTPTPDISQIPDKIDPINDPKEQQAVQQAQQQTQQQQLQAALNDIKTASITAVIKTSKGDISLLLDGKNAPITVYNFVQRAKNNYFNNLTFHRVEAWVIQGGDPNGDGSGGGNIPVEFNNNPFTAGSLGQASRGDGKVQNDSQFFITKSDASWLNGKYTNYGSVISGMDVVTQIEIGDKIQSISVTQVNQ